MSMVVTLLAMVIVFYPPISKKIKVLFGGFFSRNLSHIRIISFEESNIMSMVVTLLAMVIVFYPPISKKIKVLFGGFFNGIGKVVFVILIIIGFLVTGPIGWVISAFLFLVFYGIKHY